MLAADKVHKDSNKKQKGQDPSNSGSLALCQGQVFADRINRFKKAAGLAVFSPSVKKVKTKASSRSKSNLCERDDIQRTCTDKCDTQRTCTDKYDTPRTCTDTRDGRTVGDRIRGITYACNETAEFRRHLQVSHNRQRLLATLSYAEQERKEAECGYRMSSNGVLVSTRKADVYTHLHLVPTDIEDGNTRLVVESDESAGECDTYTDYEEEEVDEDDEDYNIDACKKSAEDSMDMCRKRYVNNDKYNVYTRNTSSRLPKENESIEERCSKNIPGSQLKAYYIFDSAEMECYDHCPGKTSFVPDDYIGNYKVQGVQLRQLTDSNTKLMRSTQQDTEKEVVPVLVISEKIIDAGNPHNEKTKANENDRLEARKDPVEEQQGTRLVIESLKDKESQDFTCTLENEDVLSIAASEDSNRKKEVTLMLEYQDKRLVTESLEDKASQDFTCTLENEDMLSIAASEDDNTKRDVTLVLEYQDTTLVTESLKYGEGTKDTCLLEHENTRLETASLKNGESTNDSFLLEHQDARLINEPLKYEEYNQCTSVLYQHGRKSVTKRLECEDDLERTCVWNHQTGIKDNQELYLVPPELYSVPQALYSVPQELYQELYSVPQELYSVPQELYSLPQELYSVPQELYSVPQELKYALESHNVVEVRQDVEFDSLSERYVAGKQDMRYALELQEVCDEVQETKSPFEPQVDAKNKHEVGSMLLSQGGVVDNPTIRCGLLSQGNFEEHQEVNSTSEIQVDTSGNQEVRSASETSEDAKGDSNSISDAAKMKYISTSHDDSDETRGDGCVSRQHAGFEDTDRVEPVTMLQHDVGEYNSSSLKKLEEHKQGDYKRGEPKTENTALKKMVANHNKEMWAVHEQVEQVKLENDHNKEMWAVHEQVEHEQVEHGQVEHEQVEQDKLENATERNKHIHSTQEGTFIQKNPTVVNASSPVIYVQEENVEQEQGCDAGDSSHTSCNDEYEIASEDDNENKSDLGHQLVFFEEYQSGDRRYTSPYSKFQRLHEDLLKGLTCPSESDDRENSSDCEYEYNEQDEEETEEEIDGLPEDNTVGCDTVPSDRDRRDNKNVTIQILNPLNLSVVLCENKLIGQCDVKNFHVCSDAMVHGVQCNGHTTSGAAEDINEDADHGLQSDTSSTEDNKDHIKVEASKDVRALDCGEKNIVHIASDICQPKEAFTLQVVQCQDSHGTLASTDSLSESSFTREDNNGVAVVYCLGDIPHSCKADKEDQFDQQDKYIDKDKEAAPGLVKLQMKVDKSHIEIEKNSSTLVGLAKDNKIQSCFNCRTRQSTRTSAIILGDDSSESNSPRYSTIDSRNESIKQNISQTSSRSKCNSSQKLHTDIEIPPMCNHNISSSGIDDMSNALFMVQPFREEFTTSTDQYESFCNSMQPSESHVSVTARHMHSINMNETCLNYAESFSYDDECNLQCEIDDNKQYTGMLKREYSLLQDVAVNKIRNENLFDKTSMVELVIAQELRRPCINHIDDSEPTSLASTIVSFGTLTGHDPQQPEQNEALNVNLAAHVNENCIGWKTVSQTATESFTELVFSSGSGSEVMSDRACLDVRDAVDRVDTKTNTAVCSALKSDTLENANQINSLVMRNTGMSGYGICEENTKHRPCHNSGAGRIANSRLSVLKVCPDLAYSDAAVYDKAGNSVYGHCIPTTLTTEHGSQGSEMRKDQEEAPFGNETNNDDISAHALDLLPQRMESSHNIAASGDFIISTMTTIKQDTDKRLSELLCVQRKTCVTMMKNVLSRAEKSKKVVSTSKTVPVLHPEKKDQCPLFCMVTGSKIEACHRKPASKATCSSDTHVAPTRLKPMQKPQKPHVRPNSRKNCRTMANSSNINQKQENLNRRNRSMANERLCSKIGTEGSELAKGVNMKQGNMKLLHQCNSKQSMTNLTTDQSAKKSMFKQGHNEKQSFMKTATCQENDFKHSGKCTDQLPVSKIPRRVKTCTFSQAKYTQENRNANYSEVHESLTQPCPESSDAQQSVSQQIHRASVVHKDICAYSESGHDELIFTDAPGRRSETTDLGSSSRGMNYTGTRHVLEEHSRDIVTHTSAAECVLNQGHSSEQHLYQSNVFGGEPTEIYFNNARGLSAHATGDVLRHNITKHVTIKNSQELQKEQVYCYSRGKLDNVSNHDGRNQSQQALCETDRSVSVQQSPITQSQRALCETDKSMYVQQCPKTQPHRILCETTRPVCAEQSPITQLQQKLCEAGASGIAKQSSIPQSRETSCVADRAVNVQQSSKTIVNSTRNEQIIHPTCGSQPRSTDYHDEQFTHPVGDIHLPWNVAEDKSYSLFGLHPIERKQDLCWNNQMSDLTSVPVKVETDENLASNTPTIDDVNEVYPTAIKEKHAVRVNTEATTILSNSDDSWDNGRASAKPIELSSYNTKISTSLSEAHHEPVNNHDIYDVSINDMINSDKVCINMPVGKFSVSNTVTFRSMVKNLMNQSEELASDSDNDAMELFISEKQKRNESVFPMSLSENNKSNWEEEITYKRIDHDPEKANITQEDNNDDLFQKHPNIEAATCPGGIDNPTYAELKFKALSKVLPVLGKLKLHQEKHMHVDTVANNLPFEGGEQRTTSDLHILQQSVNATSLTYNPGTDAELFTNDYFKEAVISKSEIFMKELTNNNSFSGFNINNSKSDQGIDRNKDNAASSQENIGENAIICGIEKVNLVQKDIVSVTSRDPRSTHQCLSVGKPTVRRKCRIPVRQNSRPCVLPEKVEISHEKHLKTPRNIVMVLKSKDKRKGNVAAALSLVQPTDSSISNAADTKHTTELPKHVQVFTKGNEVVVEVCTDSSSTAASVPTTEQVRAPLAERIRKYQQTRPRNILAGRNHTQDESALENASKLLKKIPGNTSSCSEVLSIPSNSLVQTCEQAHKSVKSCVRIDKARESDTSTPRSSKTFNVSVDEDTSISRGSKEKMLVKVDSVSQEDVAIQTSDNTLATPVTVPTTYLQIHKKDVAEQTSISSSNKSNSGAEELNVNATVTESKSLEDDSSYNVANSKTSENLSIPGSLTKAKTSLSSCSKQYLKKNVAFSSKLVKTTPDCMKTHRDHSGACRNKHTVVTLQRRYQDTPEKCTQIDTTNARRQQRYKKLERPARLEQTSKDASSNLMSHCQLFSSSSHESNESTLQQGPANALGSQNSLGINIQNMEIHQQNLQSNSRNSNTIDEQDICEQQTIVTNFESDGDEIFLHIDDEKFRPVFDDDKGLQNESRHPSSNCRRIDESKLCDAVFSRRVCNKGENNLVSPEDIVPDSGTGSHITFTSSQCELAEPKQLQQTQWAARNQDSLLKKIDSICSLKTPECAASLSDSNKQRTKNSSLALTVSSKLNLEEYSHADCVPDSGVVKIQMMNNKGDSRQVNYAQDSIKTSQTDCDGLEETHVTTESWKLTETDNYKTVTQKRTTGGSRNISMTVCASPTEEEAIESNRLSVSDSCHALAEEILVNDSKHETHSSYKNVKLSAFNKQKENAYFNPIPATVSPKVSIKRPKAKSLLFKSVAFTAEDSSSKSSLRSNENGNAHIYVATRKPDYYNPLSMLPTDTQGPLVDNTNITPDICLNGGTMPDGNRPTANLEWQTDSIINQSLETFENGERTQVYLPQARPEIMSRRSKSINNKTPRSPHSRNNLSACLRPQTPDVSAKQVKILETMSISPGVVNEGRLGEITDMHYDRHSLSLPVKRDNNQKATQIISTHCEQNLGNKTSNTLELVARRSDLYTPEMSNVMATDGQHKGMTTPRKGKITFINQDMEDYGGLSPGVINSRPSLSYSTTSQESTAETHAYSSREHVTAGTGHVTTSNNTEQKSPTASPSARHRQPSRTSEEMLNSDKPNLPPLSSRQSGLPHRPHFKRYY